LKEETLTKHEIGEIHPGLLQHFVSGLVDSQDLLADVASTHRVHADLNV